MEFIRTHLATIITAFIVFGAFAWIVIASVRRSIRGKGSCTTGCSMCPMAGSCSITRRDKAADDLPAAEKSMR
ncbi:MAG: FeoB-associated Cys-rich membrane protein [Sphaerochaetaceae bacterium]|nr:FeoB-associated Cys-rich membrane protein [Spirochaetales bacterium]